MAHIAGMCQRFHKGDEVVFGRSCYVYCASGYDLLDETVPIWNCGLNASQLRLEGRSCLMLFGAQRKKTMSAWLALAVHAWAKFHEKMLGSKHSVFCEWRIPHRASMRVLGHLSLQECYLLASRPSVPWGCRYPWWLATQTTALVLHSKSSARCSVQPDTQPTQAPQMPCHLWPINVAMMGWPRLTTRDLHVPRMHCGHA